VTPEEWTNGLDLPNLIRYGSPLQMRGLIATAIREAVAEMREECAAKVEQQGQLLKNMFETDKYDALIGDLAKSIRGIS
jgi:hypothetical protein